MKPTTILISALALVTVLGCAAPIPPRGSEPAKEQSPPPSANQPSNVETTSAEYDRPSSSTGSSAPR